jgi:hypothetical protein
MAGGHGWGGASRAGYNHPALASASAAPSYPSLSKGGALSRTYVAVYNSSGPLFLAHLAFSGVWFLSKLAASAGLAQA